MQTKGGGYYYYLDNKKKIHASLIVAHIFWTLGKGVEVVTTTPSAGGGGGGPGIVVHPLQWAFIRNFGAGLVLVLGSCLYYYYFVQHDDDVYSFFDDNGKPISTTKRRRSTASNPSWKTHWKSFALVGLVLFGIQGGLILGMLLTGGGGGGGSSTTIAAAVRFWHPISLILTAWFIRLFGWESHQSTRYRGIAIATLGCWILLLLSLLFPSDGADTTTNTDASSSSFSTIILSIISSAFGHYFLFIHSACSALYMCYSKVLLTLYPPLVVAAGAYSFATIYMLVFWIMLSIILPNNSHDFFCPQCTTTSSTTRNDYNNDIADGPEGYLLFLLHHHVLPREVMPAMIYDILFGCVAAYGIFTWANQYCTGTLVMSYTLLQPVIVIVLTTTFAELRFISFSGIVTVLCGLYWTIATEEASNLLILDNKEEEVEEDHHHGWEETLALKKKEKKMPEGPFVTEVARIEDYDICLHIFNSATLSSGSPKAVVVFLHGWNSHGTYPTTRMLADLVMSKGYAFVAPDMPGHGVSSGTPGYVGRGEEVSQVVAAIIEHIHGMYNLKESGSSANSKQQQPLKIFVVGSSMGGNLALQGALRCCSKDKNMVSGVVLLAPMLRLRPMGPLRPLLKFYRTLLPMVEFIPLEKMINYRCPKVQKAVEDDPFKPHQEGDRILIRSVASLAELTESLEEQFDDVTCPMMVMIADEDKVIDNEGAFDLISRAKSTDVVVKQYPALHGLMGEPSPLIDRIQDDLISWLDDRYNN